MKILIVDDDVFVRRLLQLTLQRLGHECSLAGDGLEAWAHYERDRPDVIISDWIMPGLDGVQLCRRIRAAETSDYCYLILLTSLEDRDDVITAIRAGADDHLVKPLDAATLEVRLMVAARVTALHARLAGRDAELKRLNQALAVEARRDPLTQLGNRLRMTEDLDAQEARHARYGHGYSVALCDVDRFKAFNDRHGHPAGDQILQLIAGTLSRECRTADTLYRYGGEELLILLPGQTVQDAVVLCERMRLAVERLAVPHPDNRPSGLVTASFGVAGCLPASPAAMADVVRGADRALYRAKAHGRNRVEGLARPIPPGREPYLNVSNVTTRGVGFDHQRLDPGRSGGSAP